MARSGTTSAQIDQGEITPVGFINASGVLVAASDADPIPTTATLSGGGDASAAKQDAQTALLTTIDSDTSRLTSSAGPLDAGAALATTAFMVGGKYDATPPTLTDGQQASALLTVNGEVVVADAPAAALLTTIDADTGSIASDAATIAALNLARSATPAAGQPGVALLAIRDDALSSIAAEADEGEVTLARVDANGAVWVQLAGALSASVDSMAIGAAATNGCSVHNTIDLDETEEEVKATAGTVYGMYLVNRDTAPVYVKFYNAAAADVTVGTTTPYMTLEVPYSAASHLGTVFVFPPGIAFGTAICVAATTGLADNDTGAPGANDVTAVVFYK